MSIEYEIVDHGIEHEQYFQGCGVAFTKYTAVFTGIGNSLREALDDAASQLAEQGFEIPTELAAEIEESTSIDMRTHVDQHYYASIRVLEGGDDNE